MVELNLYEAKTQLSKLVDAAAQGETIIIAKAGRPLAKLTRVDSPERQQRLGFLAGRASIPDDFDRIGADELDAAFHGEP
ncbi:type II toxin-antitoxin system Phd/YefM family antitoxin [Occultella kanbiaonis]|uniref:type II toxin-antitoxin system Phd/YefM family antitoxin n=1 Tax=Occultella kanbiaonis TaxID=2675754 RepID=UPI0013D6DFC9|nr:type II toxin-antitoxin system prevent-host-death family antitoxin [Occultella kanbiaonis]